MRLLLLPVLLSLGLVNCVAGFPFGGSPVNCGQGTDGGGACSRRVNDCSTDSVCRPLNADEPTEDCFCRSATPCDEQEPLTCFEGGCQSGEVCDIVGTNGADLALSAQERPFGSSPGLATAFTNLTAGQVILIEASGTAQYGTESQTGCAGVPDVEPNGRRSIAGTLCTPRRKTCGDGCAVPKAAVGAVIARIGTGPWFAVNFGVVHDVGHNGPSEVGPLVVAFNEAEGEFADNTGSYQVHVERITDCSCVATGPVTTALPSAAADPVSRPAIFTPPPGATFALSTEVPGRSAVHTVVFESGVDDEQGYSATVRYPAAFVFEGFTALGPVNTRVGLYSLDFDFDGEPDYRTWIRSTGADTAYADIDLSGSPTASDAIITRGTGNVFTIVAPDGGDRDAAEHSAPEARVTVTLHEGVLTNPPTPGDFELELTVVSVDPDTGGADDGEGAEPTSFTIEQMVPVGCDEDGDCDDALACTVDACAAEICTNTPLEDIPGAVCALDELLADERCGKDPVAATVGDVIAAKVAKAKTFLGVAATAKPKKRIASIKKAEMQLTVAGRAVKKGGRKQTITTACRDTLLALITAKKAELKALRTPAAT